MTEQIDKAVDEALDEESTTEEEEQDGRSEETKEEVTLEKVFSLVKALQKGYTITRQDQADLVRKLENIADGRSKGGKSDEDEEDTYLTTKQARQMLREVLQENAQAGKLQTDQVERYVETTLDDLESRGVLSGTKEREALLEFATEIEEPDLLKAHRIWTKTRQAESNGAKKAASIKAREEVAGKTGGSKSGASNSEGIDIKKMREMEWY